MNNLSAKTKNLSAEKGNPFSTLMNNKLCVRCVYEI